VKLRIERNRAPGHAPQVAYYVLAYGFWQETYYLIGLCVGQAKRVSGGEAKVNIILEFVDEIGSVNSTCTSCTLGQP
jgi:hypothetical protein